MKHHIKVFSDDDGKLSVYIDNREYKCYVQTAVETMSPGCSKVYLDLKVCGWEV